MKKVSCEQQGSDVNISKKEIPEWEINRERFPFNRSYFQFYTPSNIFSSYVDSTRDIVSVLSISMNCFYCHIYTIDGYLISTFSCRKVNTQIVEFVKMFFSDLMCILLQSFSIYMHELRQYNDYTVIRLNFQNQTKVCFDCDRDCIYVSRTQMNVNYINLYTHDFQILRTIDLISGINVDMKVQNDSIYCLNKPSSPGRYYELTKLVQISLEGGRTVDNFCMFHETIPYPKFISFHPMGYVIIGYPSTERLSILYRNEIVYYNDVTSVGNHLAVSCMATTATGLLVCASYRGRCIRVYSTVDVCINKLY